MFRSGCLQRALLLVCGREPPPPAHPGALRSHTNLSVLSYPQKAADLADMINRVIREGLEGLVLKDVKVSR